MDGKEILKKPVVRKYMHKIVGPEGIQVAMSLPEGEFTDEELADQLGEDVNTIRRVLIILNDNNLSEYRRVRDQESGWLTYYWAINYERIPKQMKEEMEFLLEKLKKRYEFEKNTQFYSCQVCYTRSSFDDAMETGFICPQCGSDDLEAEEFNDILDKMEMRINDIEEELESIESNL